MGTEKIIKKMKKKNYLDKDILQKIRECEQCQKCNPSRRIPEPVH
jgi:hypothetical protein